MPRPRTIPAGLRWPPRPPRGWGLIAWIPLLPAAAYGIVLLGHLRSLIEDINWNSDVAAPMVLAGALPDAPDHPTIHLGSIASYTTLWFDWLTRGLPGHGRLWQVAPFALTLVTLAILVWTSWRVAGRWAAAATFVIGFAVSPAVLFSQLAQAVRVTTWFNIVLLAAFLGLLASRAMRTPALAAAAGVVTLITALDIASDPLLLLAGLVPFALAPLLLVRHPGRAAPRLLLTPAACTAAAAAVAALTGVLVSRAGFQTGLQPQRFATLGQIGGNAQLLVAALLDLGNGGFFGHAVNASGVGMVVCAVAVTAALVVVVRPLSMAPWRRSEGADDLERARLLVITFWSISAVTVLAAFLLSTIAVDSSSSRYLIALVYAAAAVVPIWAARSRPLRLLSAGLIAAVALMSTHSLRTLAAEHGYQGLHTRELPAVVAFLEGRGLSRGYAGYWSANPLTLHSGGRIRVAPVAEGSGCGGADPGMLCSYPVNSISSWYIPVPGVPTFVVIDPITTDLVNVAPSATLGTPSLVRRIGRITIYVYPFDVAERFPS